MPLVEKRYAEALVELASGKGMTEEIRSEFCEVVGAYNENSQLKYFLLNPEVKTEVKKNIVVRIFEGQISNELMNFIKLLLDKGRIKYIEGILSEYNILADRRKNILNLKIISAAPLEETQVENISDKFMKKYRASDVKVERVLEPDLLGGVKVQVGDRVSDGTIKGRLEELKEFLTI